MSTSFIIKEIEIKSTKRYRFASSGMAEIDRHTVASTGKDLEKVAPQTVQMRTYKVVLLLWKKVWQFLKMLAVP